MSYCFLTFHSKASYEKRSRSARLLLHSDTRQRNRVWRRWPAGACWPHRHLQPIQPARQSSQGRGAWLLQEFPIPRLDAQCPHHFRSPSAHASRGKRCHDAEGQVQGRRQSALFEVQKSDTRGWFCTKVSYSRFRTMSCNQIRCNWSYLKFVCILSHKNT